MEVALAGLEETGEMAVGVWLNPSQVRTFLKCRHLLFKAITKRKRFKAAAGATGSNTTQGGGVFRSGVHVKPHATDHQQIHLPWGLGLWFALVAQKATDSPSLRVLKRKRKHFSGARA